MFHTTSKMFHTTSQSIIICNKIGFFHPQAKRLFHYNRMFEGKVQTISECSCPIAHSYKHKTLSGLQMIHAVQWSIKNKAAHDGFNLHFLSLNIQYVYLQENRKHESDTITRRNVSFSNQLRANQKRDCITLTRKVL